MVWNYWDKCRALEQRGQSWMIFIFLRLCQVFFQGNGMPILVVIFSCMDYFAFVVTVDRYDSISFCRLLTSGHTSKWRKKRLLEKLSTSSKFLHNLNFFQNTWLWYSGTISLFLIMYCSPSIVDTPLMWTIPLMWTVLRSQPYFLTAVFSFMFIKMLLSYKLKG